MCLVPRDEKIGQLAAGIKVLNEKIFELQSMSSYEEVKRLAAVHNEVNTDMLDINKKIQKLINGTQESGEKDTQASGERKNAKK